MVCSLPAEHTKRKIDRKTVYGMPHCLLPSELLTCTPCSDVFTGIYEPAFRA